MRRVMSFIVFCGLIFTTYVFASANVSTGNTSKKVTLNDVIAVIDQYLSQNVTPVVEKIAAEKEFQLKLFALRVRDKFGTKEIFDVLDEFENLLGDYQFVSEGTIFKRSTIYLYRAKVLQRASDVNLMFDRIADFVLTKCADKKEQWEILNDLLDSYGISEVEPKKAKNLDQVLKLYFVLSEYFYKEDKKFFYQSAFSTYTTIWTSITAEVKILDPIVKVAQFLGGKLSKEQKELILKESMKYVEPGRSYPDEVVKIYYYLNK